jgi:adenylate cyclase
MTAQLIDALSGRHLWSDRYDGELKDLFAVQDEIPRSVVAALAIKLIGLETERAFAKPTDNLEAYDYVLRGREYIAAGTDQANSEARSLFERAIRLDPAYASAYAALGWTWLMAAESGWTEFRADALQQAESLAAKAIGLDDGNAEAHGLLGSVYLDRGQYDLAINEQARAIALNPSDAASYAAQGAVLLFTGHPKEAIGPFETATRLNPSGSRNLLKAAAGWAYYIVQRYDDAVRVLERAARNFPDDYYIHAGLAAAYAKLGRTADASRAAAAVLKAWPFF